MRRYDEWILNQLIDRYENSLLYTGENRHAQTISLSITRSTFTEYFDDSFMQYDIVHEQLLEAEQKGYLRLVWKNGKVGHILEKCVLCTEKADEIYAFLHRRSRAEKEHRITEICERNRGLHPVIDRFLDWICSRMERHESIRKYVDIDNPEQFSRRCLMLEVILTNDSEIFWREFSARFFNDSKIAEKELITLAGIISVFTDEADLRELEPEQLLEEFGIYRNPSYVMLKGCGRFRIGDSQYISLEDFSGGIGLNSVDIGSVIWDKAGRPGRVLTIENLTSFHRFSAPDTLCVYLGGYHNRVKCLFLKNMYEAFTDTGVQFSHFGDIDCDGFKIWRNLREKTGIPFSTYLMDAQTYRAYLRYGRPLTDRDRTELARMKADPYFSDLGDLFDLMEREGRKLEQECVIF